MAELIELDPTSEDATNSPLSLMTSTYRVMTVSWASPDQQVIYASSIDTEGELPAARKVGNRTITLTLEVVGSSAATLRTALVALQAKIAKIQREGGTLKRTLVGSQVQVFDLLTAGPFDPAFDLKAEVGFVQEVTLTFTAQAYGRGADVTLSSHSETSLPCLVFTETTVTGDAPALGRLVVTEAQGADQAFLIWGQQQRAYSSSANAALFYEAEGRTALSGAATAAGPTGGSGAGSNVVRHTALSTVYQAMLGTQATGGGAHLSHIGDFSVFARVQVPATNTGVVSVALEWGEGDFRVFTRNTGVAIDTLYEGYWMLLDLGQVHLNEVVSGTQRWEGRILAKSTVAGDDLDIDYLMLVPVTEGSGRITASTLAPSPTAVTAQSYFATESGAITGDSLATGGTWTGAGDTDDFTVSGGVASRTAVSDTGSGVAHGRLITASGSTLAGTRVSVTTNLTAVPTISTHGQGVIARYVDSSNFMAAGIGRYSVGTVQWAQLTVWVVTSGTATTLATNAWVVGDTSSFSAATCTLVVTTSGAFTFDAAFTSGTRTLTGTSAILAAGGALDDGTAGIVDYWPTPTASTRSYTGFQVWGIAGDAAIFASQSTEIRHDRVVREDTSGTLMVPVSRYEGDYLLIPPAGLEARTNRFIVKASRGFPGVSADSAIDDISAQLVITPRYLVVS